MASSIFYPYFYLSNDTLLRHQYLYVSTILRIHPCDRPPRDNKQVKRFVSDLMQVGFLENASQEEFDSEINDRFLQIVERGFQLNRPLYLKILGKYEKERASAKTFHLCRKKLWENLVQRLTELGIATVDNYDEWCFSTRMMVMAMTICVTLVRQREMNLIRCTDMLEYDDLASLIECLPQNEESDATLRRAILEFPYIAPKNLSSMHLDRLQTLRDDLATIAENFQQGIMDDSSDLQRSTSPAELNEQVKCISERIQDMNQKISDDLTSRNEPVQTFYAQYRWYLPQDLPLNEITLEAPIINNDVAFTMVETPVSPEEIARIATYPGSLVWAQETPAISRTSAGFLKRLFSFGKS